MDVAISAGRTLLLGQVLTMRSSVWPGVEDLRGIYAYWRMLCPPGRSCRVASVLFVFVREGGARPASCGCPLQQLLIDRKAGASLCILYYVCEKFVDAHLMEVSVCCLVVCLLRVFDGLNPAQTNCTTFSFWRAAGLLVPASRGCTCIACIVAFRLEYIDNWSHMIALRCSP